jgi:hypothetical protein
VGSVTLRHSECKQWLQGVVRWNKEWCPFHFDQLVERFRSAFFSPVRVLWPMHFDLPFFLKQGQVSEVCKRVRPVIERFLVRNPDWTVTINYFEPYYHPSTGSLESDRCLWT